MKNTRNEEFSEHLLNVDEEILTNAYEIDNVEKLRQYIKTKNAKTKKPFYLSSLFRRIATVAACFVLIISIMFSIPALINQGSSEVTEKENDQGEATPPLINENGFLTINSISQLNYYAAVRMLTEESKATGLSLSGFKASGTGYGILLLSAGSDTDKYEQPPVPETTGPDLSQEPAATPNEPTSPNPDEDIYYYSLDPNEPFYINRVTMFRIELTDEKGFLASRLGLGTVDVVITEDCIWGESMITFRNGESFFSCLTNGGGYDPQSGEWHWDFSTHKYVEGFFIVKNLAQENYGFTIKMDAQSQAFEFDCYETEKGGDRVDKNVKIVGSTATAEEGRRFTVAELENYFNTGNMPDKTESEETAVLPESVEKNTYNSDI